MGAKKRFYSRPYIVIGFYKQTNKTKLKSKIFIPYFTLSIRRSRFTTIAKPSRISLEEIFLKKIITHFVEKYTLPRRCPAGSKSASSRIHSFAKPRDLKILLKITLMQTDKNNSALAICRI